MPRGVVTPASLTTPRRGELFPNVSGLDSTGRPCSIRDYYMRSNLAVVIAGKSTPDAGWMKRVGAEREQAHAEAGEILIIGPRDVSTYGLPHIVDDGQLARSLGLSDRVSPAIFAIDRYGLVFATNAGDAETTEIQPEDIPGWLEFIACRCS